MSNLLKQRYVINLESQTRIINSDDKYMSDSTDGVESLDGGRYLGEPDEDGFISGLEAEEIYVEPEITPEEILEQARIEAEEILTKAQAEAAHIANEASQQAEILFEQKRQDGYQLGSSQAADELEQEKMQMQNDFQKLEEDLKAQYDAKFQTMEKDIVDAMVHVFNRVFHIQFDNKKQILLQLIKETVLNIETNKEFRIRVADSNFKFVESHIGDIKEKVGNDVTIEIVNDVTLEEGDCRIETQYGVYDCGIDMELSNLEKDIRSLCR